ncbi:MAG TPA: hypothetical protein VMF69_25080 [Gemmataceae bacterium]|nr:hypothetical protein [Gemmataceae bacterium]
MTAEELGEIRREFKPGLENLVAGIVIGLLLIVGGCVLTGFSIKGAIESGGNLPLWTEKGQRGWSWGAVGIAGALGIGLMIGGFVLIYWMRSLFSLQVRVGQNGFAVIEKKSIQIIAWEEIESVRETHLYERPPLLKGVAKYALPKLMSKIFMVRIKGHEPGPTH